MSWGGAEPEREPGQPPTQPGSDAGAGKSGLVFEQAYENAASCNLQFLWVCIPSPFKAFECSFSK